MESQKRRRGRPATGRSQESLETEKLSRSIWYGSRSSVWFTKRIDHTWKVVKGMCLFNSDLTYNYTLYTEKYATGYASSPIWYT